HRFGVARAGEPVGDIAEIELRHGVGLPGKRRRTSGPGLATGVPRAPRRMHGALGWRAESVYSADGPVSFHPVRRLAMIRRPADRPLFALSSELGQVMAAAREREQAGGRVVHLERGEPDFDTPPHVVEALAAAARAGDTHYPEARGTRTLREA